MNQVFVIIDSNTLEVIDWYFQDSPIVPVTPGITLEVPEGLTWDMVKAVRDSDGSVTLVEDPRKVEDHKAALWSQLRAERNRRLAACDWTQLTDAHMSQDRKDAWATYRQALRDLPDELTDPTQVTWPSDPTVPVPVQPTGSRLDNLLSHADAL